MKEWNEGGGKERWVRELGRRKELKEGWWKGFILEGGRDGERECRREMMGGMGVRKREVGEGGKEGERKKGRMEDEVRDGVREGCREEKNLGMEVR